MGTRILIVVVVAVCALLACEKRSSLYCGKHPDDLANCERMDAPIAPPKMCGSNSDCSPPFCELGAGLCVGCLMDGDCATGERCDQMSFTCKGCVDHVHCTPSQACLPGGTCGTDDTVLYVDPAGDDANTCTQAAKCRTIERALLLVSATRRYIKLSGSLTESPLINATDVSVIADPGTTLTGATSVDWVIKIQQSQVKINDLVIQCTSPTDQTGIKTEMSSTTFLSGLTISGCGRGGGIEGKGGFVSVTRSTIRNNPAGGIQTDAAANFHITNNFIHHNGTTTGNWAGVWLDADMIRPEQKFDFNTVVDNLGSTNVAIGIKCRLAIRTDNSIIARNGDVLAINTSGCEAGASINVTDVAPLRFRAPDAAMPDYHIEADSSARDTAPVASSTVEDFDGELRPPDGKDYGADEYRVPMP